MSAFYTRLAVVAVTLLQFSATAFAGPLDDYYLQQFGETNNTRLQKAILGVLPLEQEAAHCGMPLKKGLRRDWDLLEPSTQKVLAKQLALPALASPATYTSIGGHFTVHYATTAPTDPSVPDDRPPMTDLNNNDVPDWVEDVAATFENVYTSYGVRGYRPAPTTGGNPYDIYLLDLAPQEFYGVTQGGGRVSSTGFPNAFSSWMEIDNNFTDSIYHPTTYSPLQSLQITAAHEYHHAVQFGYNYYFDTWYAEATSTWLEDELYNDVNQLYDYIPDWFAQSYLSLDITESTTTGGGYGRWIFNRYLSEQHSPTMIRNVWEKLAGLSSSGGDIPMAPVLDSVLSSTYASTLGNDFFGFTKRVYQRDWTDHDYDINNIHPHSPLASYSVGTIPVSAGTTPAPSVTLPHYSFAYYRFVPTSGAPNDLEISITSTSGIKATVFKKNGSSIVEFPFTGVDAKTIAVPGFSTSTEVVLLITNVTNVDNHSANFSTNGTDVSVTEPSGGTVYPPPPATPTNTSSGGGGGGCFIATAAYGSYLHPQVQLLRNFRDQYLLTNAPGRAFVTLYYRCSPPLADLIARHPMLRGMARLALTPLVAAVAHPLISAVALFLVAGALLRSLRRRFKAARSNIHPHVIRVT